MKKLLYLFLASATISLNSCGDGKEKEPENPEPETPVLTATDEVIDRIDSLKDVGEAYWKLLEQSDSTKYASIERLLLEISYNAKHNPATLEDLQAGLEAVRGMSYDMLSIPDTNKIDEIDQKVTEFITSVFRFSSETEGMDGQPLAAELMDTILHLDREVLPQLRGDFSMRIDLYNAYIAAYAASLKEMGKTYTPIQTYFQEEKSLLPHEIVAEYEKELEKFEAKMDSVQQKVDSAAVQ